MDRLKSRIKLSKRFWFYYVVVMVIFMGFFFTMILGVFGYWRSIAWWAVGIVLSGLVLYTGYTSVSRMVVKRLLAFLLFCVMITLPLFAVFAVFRDQSTSQNLSSQHINYFKNLLGKSYNYTELRVWENKHLIFTYEDIERNTDPIKIYEYGKGRCEEFAILYAALCISQGYRCRIVHNVFNDHVFNEVLETNGTWVRVDASLGENDTRAVGYPMFFEKEPTWTVPILSLAFENSTITEVTSTYRSDGFRLLSPMTIALLITICFLWVVAIAKLLILPVKSAENKKTMQILS